MPARTPLLLLPGLNNSSASWAPVVERLAERATATAIDLPPLTDIDAIADEVASTIATPTIVVGHSFGGYVALAVLERHPEAVAAIVLVNSGTGADSEAASVARLNKAEKAAAGGYEEAAAAAGARAYHPDNGDNAELMRARATGIAEYGAERYVAHQHATAARPARTTMLAAAQLPKLFVAASHDAVIPSERQRADAEASGADFVTIDGAGHMLPMEQPGQLADVLAALAETVGQSINGAHR